MISRPAVWATLGLLGAIFLAPPLLGGFWTAFLARAMTWTYLAISFSLAYSYAGIPSIAQGSLFGVGAYSTVWLARALHGSVPALLGAALFCSGLLAAGLGAILVRMTKDGAAIATIIVAVILFLVGNAAVPYTGGANGMSLPTTQFSLGPLPVPAGPSSATLYLANGLLILLLAVFWLSMTTPTWTILRAIQQNETRAAVLGYSVGLYRLAVFSAAGAVAGLGGSLYALVSVYVTTDMLSLLMSFKAILWAVVGGVGTVVGAPVGVLFVQAASEVLARWTVRADSIIGALLILTAIFLPDGILVVPGAMWRSRRQMRRREGVRGTGVEAPGHNAG